MTTDDATLDEDAPTRRALRAHAHGEDDVAGAEGVSDAPDGRISSPADPNGETAADAHPDASLPENDALSTEGSDGDAVGESGAALLQTSAAEQTEDAAAGPVTDDGSSAGADAAPAAWADEHRTATALTWLSVEEIDAAPVAVPLDAQPVRADREPDILAGARLRPGFLRPRILIPVCTIAALAVGYIGCTLLYPLDNVAPTVSSVEFSTTGASAATLTWPTEGSAAVSVSGVSAAASSTEQASIASITKVVTVLMILDQLPLQQGEQGPSYEFTSKDNAEYWSYRSSNQSALEVPVGGSLTEYQMLQAILLESASNYIDRMAGEIWGSDAQFAQAASAWLESKGLTGLTIVTPSGFSAKNTATPEALLALADLAMQNPVFAEIVGTRTVDLPGVGTLTNTNGMLEDPGVVGVKTGTLVGWDLLTAKDVTVGDTTVRLNAAVLNQASEEDRLAETRTLFSEVEAALQAQGPAVAAGTVVGEVDTVWGAHADIVTDEDASVVLWNGATPQSSVDFSFDIDEQNESGDDVGTLAVDGPLNDASVGVSLDEDVAGPSIWWRLTHPMELFGLSHDAN